MASSHLSSPLPPSRTPQVIGDNPNPSPGESKGVLISKIREALLEEVEEWKQRRRGQVPLIHDFCVISTAEGSDVAFAQRFIRLLGRRRLLGTSITDLRIGQDLSDYVENIFKKSGIIFVVLSAAFHECGLHRILTETALYGKERKRLVPVCRGDEEFLDGEFCTRTICPVRLPSEEEEVEEEEVLRKLCRDIFTPTFVENAERESDAGALAHRRSMEATERKAREEIREICARLSEAPIQEAMDFLKQPPGIPCLMNETNF